ncbi:MAG TPA: phage tail sheath subtilisin-like domain-containing protein [Bacteroidales bacterium]|nr:phage tail sheath subtilisin-like domain-containing protein [Bacteroidales bacterium]
MAFYLSPLVDVNEIDLSTTIPAVATSIAAIILRNTYKGPERKKTLITTVNELIDIFGKPTNVANCYQDILAATGYLRYGNALYCTRTMPVSATFAGTKAVSGSEATFTQFVLGSDALTLSDLPSKDPDQFADDVSPTAPWPFYLIANSRGEWGNNIRVAVIDYTTYNEIASGGHSEWEVYSDVSAIDSPLLNSKSFLIIVQVKPQGETSYATKEVWNVSTDQDVVDDSGNKLFAETVINESSSYIRISMNESQKDQNITISTSSWQSFGGGADDQDDSVTDALIIDDIDLYANAEEIDINILIDGNKSTTVKQYLVSIAESRKDCIAVLDCLYADVINNSGNEATSLRTYRQQTLNENTSYASIYGNWIEVYDKWNGKYRWIPCSGHIAGIYANTDDVSDPWFAPAGLNRALLGNVRRLAWNPTQGERDILYKAGINPLVSFSGQGKVVWGQKTLLDKESAFNRINVRRLFIVLEKAIATAARYFLFEPNDDLTRLLLVNMIDPFLRDVRSRRGIYDYMIVCDETNNTPERIDRNELWCDIYIKPTRAAEFIVLNFIATKTGASFTELAGATAG